MLIWIRYAARMSRPDIRVIYLRYDANSVGVNEATYFEGHQTWNSVTSKQ